jgi:holo-[acyl-carrier protein] synthase
VIHVGTDIEEISRIQRLLERKSVILRKMFFESEWEYASSRGTVAQTLCGIWCAKESVVKAFSPFIPLELTQIEIYKHASGYPLAKIHHPYFDSEAYNLSLSISHTKGLATATAIVQRI